MAKLTQAINSIRFVGLGATIRTIQYSLYRDRIEKQAAVKRMNSSFPMHPGTLKEIVPGDDRITIDYENNRLEIKILRPDMFRITWSPGKLPFPYAINQLEWDTVPWRFITQDDFVSLYTDAIRIAVGFDGSLKYFSNDGKPIRFEHMPDFLNSGWSHTANLHPQECIYGMGLKSAPLDLRGSRLTLWNTDPGGSYNPGDDPLYLNNPVYIGLVPDGSYLIFYENTHKSTFDFTKNATATFTDGALRYYITFGTMEQLLANYTQLTGRPPLPPLWSLGYHQSRWGYRSDKDVRQVVKAFSEYELPLDAIHLDIDYMNEFRVFSTDPAQFPDLSQLTKELDQKNIKVVAILDPGVKIDPKYKIFNEGMEGQMYVTAPGGSPARGLVWPGWCVFPDFSSPKVRDWWGGKYEFLLNQGIRGIWHDMNEPAVFSAWGDVTLPNNSIYDCEGQSGEHSTIHNVYGFLMNKSGFESTSKQRPQQRPWILSRSGWAGSQRYAWNWTADTNSTWEMLQQMIPTLLNMSMSGFYYSGSDIGGFSGHPSKELYIRWFQLAAYTPFFRLHNSIGLPPREPYQFDDETCAIIRQVIITRKQLLLYIYTLAYHASEFGEPLMRPMAWEAQDNPDSWEIQDQFMLGPALLIAPMLEADTNSRKVHLPPGGFYNFWSQEFYPDAGLLEISAGISEIPVFVKSGSILPEIANDQITLKLFWPQNPSEKRSFMSSLYSDAGDGYGDFRYEKFVLEQSEENYKLSRTQVGTYPWPKDGINLELIGVNAEILQSDGQKINHEKQIFRLEQPFDFLSITPHDQ